MDKDNALVTGYVLPLILCGTGLIVFKIESLSFIVGLILITLGIFVFVYTKRDLMFSLKSHAKYFPRLNINILKEFAERIVREYQDLPILNVTLFRYHSQYVSNVSSKYAMVIEVDSSIKRFPRLTERFEKLQFAAGWLGTVPDPDSSHDLGIDSSFSDVYKEKPKDDFLKEWLFYPKTSDQDMPIGIMIEEKSLILYKPPK